MRGRHWPAAAITANPTQHARSLRPLQRKQCARKGRVKINLKEGKPRKAAAGANETTDRRRRLSLPRRGRLCPFLDFFHFAVFCSSPPTPALARLLASRPLHGERAPCANQTPLAGGNFSITPVAFQSDTPLSPALLDLPPRPTAASVSESVSSTPFLPFSREYGCHGPVARGILARHGTKRPPHPTADSGLD